MSHAFSLPLIRQVKIDCHVPERGHNCVCVCMCVCVCVCACVHAPVCTGSAHNMGWMDYALCLCGSVFSGQFSCFFFLLRFGEGLPSSQTQLHPLLLVALDPVSVSPTNMTCPWHWADDFILRDSSEQQMLRNFCYSADNQMWALAEPCRPLRI